MEALEQERYIVSEEEDESFVGKDPKTLTVHQLLLAQAEVDDDRKRHSRQLRGLVWSAEDKEMMDRMNEWAKRILDELESRRAK